MTFDVYKIQPGKYHNSPQVPVPAGYVEAQDAEHAAIIAIYSTGTSRIAIVPHGEESED